MKRNLLSILVFLLSTFVAQTFTYSASAGSATPSDLPTLELGSPIPQGARKSDGYVMTSPSQLRPAWKWTYDGAEYSLGVDDDGLVRYIDTTSQMPHTSNGVHVGMTLDSLQKTLDLQLSKLSGWGYIGALPSGWKVAFVCGQSLTDCEPSPRDKVVLLYRGS